MNFSAALTALRQRKIVQTLVVYLGASWGLLQVLSFFAGTYQWPRTVIDATLFVLGCGLAAALTVAWFHGEKGHQRVTRAELTILVLLGVVGMLGGWTLARREIVEVPDDGIPREGTIAVLPFENTTGADSLAWLQNGLADMLGTDLAQIPKLRVISRSRVLDLLKQEGVTEAALVPEPAALRLARKANAGYLIQGSVFHSGGTFRVQAELRNAADGVIAYGDHVEGPELFPLVDSLAGRLAARILKSSAPGAAPTTGVAQLATANLDAYREYQLGLEAERRVLEEDAVRHMRQAVALDSTFPQALLHLGIAELRGNAIGAGLGHLASARRYLSNASERDRLMVEGMLAVASNDSATARTRFETLTRHYPDEKDAWYWLSVAYSYHRGAGWARADSVLRQVLRLDPTDPRALNQLAYMYADAGDRVRSDSFLDRYIKADPSQPNPYDTRGEIRERFGRFADARADYVTALRLRPNFLSAMDHLVRVESRTGRIDEGIADLAPYTRNADPAVAAKALSATAQLLLWKGRADAALAAYARAQPLVAKLPGEGMRLGVLRSMAEIWILQGDFARAADTLGQAVRRGAPVLWSNYIVALASLGRWAELTPLRDSLVAVSKYPELAAEARGQVEAFDALVAYYRGDWNRALSSYAASRARRGLPPNRFYSRWEVLALLSAGKPAQALPMVAGLDTLSASAAIPLHNALYLQGRVYEANARRAEAIRAYERIMADWGDNVRRFPSFRDVPDRLAKLKRG